MAAFATAGAFTQNAGSGNITNLGLPASIASGDGLLAVISQADNVHGTMSGYTELLYLTNGANQGLICFWKIAGGSESAPTYTHAAGNGAGGFLLRFTGQKSTSPFVKVGSQGNTSVTGATDTGWAPEIAPLYRNSALLFVCGEAGSGTGGGNGNNYASWTGNGPTGSAMTEMCDNMAFNGTKEACIGAAWANNQCDRATNHRQVSLSTLDAGAHTTIGVLIELADASPIPMEPYPQRHPHQPLNYRGQAIL